MLVPGRVRGILLFIQYIESMELEGQNFASTDDGVQKGYLGFACHSKKRL